jgi:ribosomal protein L12E/L44/L45/RPP1/RPP2
LSDGLKENAVTISSRVRSRRKNNIVTAAPTKKTIRKATRKKKEKEKRERKKRKKKEKEKRERGEI